MSPNGPIKWIDPAAAGGTTDTVARLIAKRLTLQTGIAVVVETKPDVGGNLSTECQTASRPGMMLTPIIGPVSTAR